MEEKVKFVARKYKDPFDLKVNRLSKKSFKERVEYYQSQGINCDPIRILMELAMGKERNEYGEIVPIAVDPMVRMKAAAEMASFMYPKLKSVEVTGDKERPISFAVVADDSPVPTRQEALKLLEGGKGELLEMSAEISAEILED